jgi:hypothetical protein
MVWLAVARLAAIAIGNRIKIKIYFFRDDAIRRGVLPRLLPTV